MFAGIPGEALRFRPRPFCLFGSLLLFVLSFRPFWLFCFCGFSSGASMTVLLFVLSGESVYCVSGGG